MGQEIKQNPEQQYGIWDWYAILPGTQLKMVVPARLELLSLLGATVREYCAALPYLFSIAEARVNRSTTVPLDREQFGTDTLTLPGQAAVTVIAGYSHFVYSTELILQEAASNIIRHGYGSSQPGQFLQLELSAANVQDRQTRLERRAFLLQLTDSAPPFDPTAALLSDPNPQEPRESGYGIYLIRKLTNGISHRYEDGHNQLLLVRYVDTIQSPE